MDFDSSTCYSSTGGTPSDWSTTRWSKVLLILTVSMFLPSNSHTAYLSTFHLQKPKALHFPLGTLSLICSTSNVFVHLSLVALSRPSCYDFDDHDNLTASHLRHSHDPIPRSSLHHDVLMNMGWRRLITYELFPFLAQLLAKLIFLQSHVCGKDGWGGVNV